MAHGGGRVSCGVGHVVRRGGRVLQGSRRVPRSPRHAAGVGGHWSRGGGRASPGVGQGEIHLFWAFLGLGLAGWEKEADRGCVERRPAPEGWRIEARTRRLVPEGRSTQRQRRSAMRVLPKTRIGRIEWFEERLDAWAADPGAIGLTEGQIIELTAMVAAARQRYLHAEQARAAARSATVGFHDAEDSLTHSGRDLIAMIKAFAETSDDAGVYVRANVPPPSVPTPAGPPEPPTEVVGEITSDGAVRLRWGGTLAHRTFYEVLRRLAGEETWTLIASIGAKGFLDMAVPVGTTSVQYRVRAKRGEAASAGSAPITLRLGVETQTGMGELSLVA